MFLRRFNGILYSKVTRRRELKFPCESSDLEIGFVRGRQVGNKRETRAINFKIVNPYLVQPVV